MSPGHSYAIGLSSSSRQMHRLKLLQLDRCPLLLVLLLTLLTLLAGPTSSSSRLGEHNNGNNNNKDHRRYGVAAADVASGPRATVSRSCRPSEFSCLGGPARCLAHDKFCDGENDCDDKSDEPPYCTPCNRTLYGDVGRTYELQIRRPREERLPFLCHINFTAAGNDLGDLVQLTFDTFTVGRFLSFTSDGCPDGHMSIAENNRPATGGQWCGSAWGYTVYYSETSSINLTLFLSRLSGQGNDYNFDFKLSYKFLRRSEAHLRYGNSSLSTWRGELVNDTYCDRVFTRCDQRACRLQSPNYPGVYPRNVTCYYRIEQKRAPAGHRALIAVSQRNSHKIHIKDQVNKYDTSQRTLRVWDQCNVVQDYLTVYDGGSNADRVLVRLCGGDAVPDIVGSRDTMLLEFHTSPYDNPFHPVPLSFLPGFELEVQVIFVDERSSASFVSKDKEKCDFYVTSYESSSGVLENPKHSLPPNTTCRFHFQAKPNEIVWLAFVKYYAATHDQSSNLAAAAAAAAADSTISHDSSSVDCNVKLLIWDGERSANGFDGSQAPSKDSTSAAENATLLGEFCKDEIPRLCDHSLLRGNGSSRLYTRPCSMSESYVSTGRHLTLEQVLRHGSALYPVSFVVRYEFVHLEASSHSCNRLFTASGSSGGNEALAFASPRSVFFYGRGGAANLSCTYRFETGGDRRLELSIRRASFGARNCRSSIDPLVNRWSCERPATSQRAGDEGIAELRLAEYPWQGVQLSRDCLCSNVSEPLVFGSLSSSRLELTFQVSQMNVTQDHEDFYFEAEYRFVPANSIPAPASPPLDPVGSAPAANSASKDSKDHRSKQQQSSQQSQQKQHQQKQQQQHRDPSTVNQASRSCHGASSDSSQPRLSRLEDRRLRGTSGEIALRSPPISKLASGLGASNVVTSSVSSSDTIAMRRGGDRLGILATIDESLSSSPLSDSPGKSASGPVGVGSSAASSAAEVTHCVNEPWLIEPEDSRLHFLYLKTPGFRLTRENVHECPTRNRIVIYPASSTHERTVVCPVDAGNFTGPGLRRSRHDRVVDLISGGWNGNGSVSSGSMPSSSPGSQQQHQQHQHQHQHARSFVVEFLQQEPGNYVVTWMAISKRLLGSSSKQPDQASSFFGKALSSSNVDCPYRCPELDACISSLLWCDGVHHCPSGFDERDENCSYRFGVTLLYVAVGAGVLGISLILLLVTGCLKYCLYRRKRGQRRRLQKKLPSQSSAEEQQHQQQHQQQQQQQQQQQRLQHKKKVQVLSVNQLGSSGQKNGTSGKSSKNGKVDAAKKKLHSSTLPHRPGQQQQQVPRYANSTFGRSTIQRYGAERPRFYRADDLDEDDLIDPHSFADKYAKDSIC
ncbi:hypothetical protein TKK_0012854 [Trichogramma kaykai]|uniref:CUB domain-containing protein n=1 Tax=Trichogramma kaykai TaxID=54128 RepID=A0ABD2WKZ5_9HYME